MPTTQTVKFHFKSRAIKDEAGNTIGRTKKQPSIDAAMPLLTPEEIQAALAVPDSAVSKLITEAVAAVILDAARGQFDEIIEGFGDDETKTVSASMLDYEKLTLDYIASIPPTQRASTALTDEDWNTFFTDYLSVMVQATGKEEARIKNHINLFKKPQKARSNKEVLGVLIEQLEIYMAASASLDDTGEAAGRILGKFKKWINEEEPKANLDLL